jgi:7-carboxy-7-deazaguanine synthase
MEERLRVFEIYTSINGEVTAFHQGSITTFIRLAGCNLRCSYCDTIKAQNKDSGYEIGFNTGTDNILSRVERFKTKYITITGGEPLLQKQELFELVYHLSHLDYYITIETNGSYPIPTIPTKYANSISWVVDYKLISSGMNKHMDWKRFAALGENDFVKFVIDSNKSLNQAIAVIKLVKTNKIKCKIAIGVAYDSYDYNLLIKTLVENNLTSVIVNTQLHKLINLA